MLNVRKFPLVSDQIEYPELSVLTRSLEKVIEREAQGDIVELGCYEGTTSLFLQRVLIAEHSDRQLHVYDSFNGLPEKTHHDASPAGEQFVAGELLASKQRLITNFKHAGLPLPRIHKVWFESMLSSDLPDKIAYAFLDGDFYTSIAASLTAITPKLVPGAVVLVDDYQSEALPGAQKAMNAWANQYKLTIRTEQSLGIVTWPH